MGQKAQQMIRKSRLAPPHGKNAFATLMCSRGPAMFFAGDEFCNTQFGNNNSYCQDNITSWLDWNRLEEYKEIHDFFRYMIRLRKDNAILRKTTKPAACKLPEISIHNGFPWNGGTDNNSRLIGIMYAGRDENDIRDDIVFYCNECILGNTDYAASGASNGHAVESLCQHIPSI